MTGKCCAVFVLISAALVFARPASAGDMTGSIRGKVVSPERRPVAGAYIYVTSPSMIGTENSITSKAGTFMVSSLPPGVYTITVEVPGYKTVVLEGLAVSAGAASRALFELEATEIEEEVTKGRPSPSLDSSSARLAARLDRDIIAHMPAPRDFSHILGLAPGILFEGDLPGPVVSAHGAPVTANIYVQDGVDVTDPVSRLATSRFNIDLIEELVVETAAHPVESGPVRGAYVNVIQQPGGNSAYGTLGLAMNPRSLVQNLWSNADPEETETAALEAPLRDTDLSLTLGGPLVKDFAWHFTSLRLRAQKRSTPFRYFSDPLGGDHFIYNFSDNDFSGLLKIGTRVTSRFKGGLEFGISKISQPVYEADIAWNRPKSATRALSTEGLFTGKGVLTYAVDPRTSVDLSLGYSNFRQPLRLNEEAATKPQYLDLGTGFSWGSGSYNIREGRRRFLATATITRHQDRFLGARHELLGGAEYETSSAESSVWKTDNLIYNYSYGSPHYYGQAVSPYSGNTVGKGLIGFWVVPKAEKDLVVRKEMKRLSLFARDNFTIAGRLTFSAGFRFDKTDASFLSTTKGSSGNEVSVTLGENLIRPLAGINPYGALSISAWDKVIDWNVLFPRASVIFDLLGDGTTLLKGSFARMPESLGLGYMEELAPVPPGRFHNFYWYDEDSDGLVEKSDTYGYFPDDFRVYRDDYYKKLVSPDLSPPIIDEWTAGLERAIGRDFTLSARFISRKYTNLIGNELFDPSTGVHWSRVEDSPEGWWVPFSTVVPGAEGYPDTPVSLYLRSTSAPQILARIENIPELSGRYRGVEVSFHKRMSHRWQLFGSVVWSRSTGTTSLASPWSAGMSRSIFTPNSLVSMDENARLDLDRTLVARLMGTVRFKWDIFLSAYFRASSGAPWARSVTIVPPETWAQENGADPASVTVFLENPGVRRYDSWKNLDLRLEKEFKLGGKTRLTAYADVLNALGDKYRTLDLNDGGFWRPSGEGSADGERILSGTYGKSLALWGARAVRIALRLGF